MGAVTTVRGQPKNHETEINLNAFLLLTFCGEVGQALELIT